MNGDWNLIIDPGMDHPASCEIMEKAIAELGLNLECTDLFITHHNLDHFGSVSRFLSGASRIYISRPEAEFIERIASRKVEEEMGAFLKMLGFPEKNPMNLIAQFYGNNFRPRRPWPFSYVADGDVIAQGSYQLPALWRPATPSVTAASMKQVAVS